MDVNGEYTFDDPLELTWKALQDPAVLASVMPGGEDFKEIGENEYSGLLNVKVGPVLGAFTGVIKLTDIVPPESYSIQVDGKGAPGFVKANGSPKLSGEGDKTHMTYLGNAHIGGRIATVGHTRWPVAAESREPTTRGILLAGLPPPSVAPGSRPLRLASRATRVESHHLFS